MIDGFQASTLLILGFLVFFAGIVDSIAGGGGLITLPSYLNAGLKTELLLGTNKLSSTFGTLMAAVRYWKTADFGKGYIFIMAAAAVAGSSAGASAISLLPAYFVKYLLIAVIPPTAIFILGKKNFGMHDFSGERPKQVIFLKSLTITLAISFYDGFFGPGTGSFFAIAFTALCGYSLVRATALSKILNFSSNISALATFLILGKIHIELGLMMAFLGIAGNLIGSTLALRKGAAVIRPLLFITANALLLKIIYDMVK